MPFPKGTAAQNLPGDGTHKLMVEPSFNAPNQQSVLVIGLIHYDVIKSHLVHYLFWLSANFKR